MPSTGDDLLDLVQDADNPPPAVASTQAWGVVIRRGGAELPARLRPGVGLAWARPLSTMEVGT